jgi:nanoRNase/pAp phosphatase (c-di-AMP/oligoRNAs hydrolase)
MKDMIYANILREIHNIEYVVGDQHEHSVLIVTHDHPDGDTIGSAIALREMIYLATDMKVVADIYTDQHTANNRFRPISSPDIVGKIFDNYTLPNPQNYAIIIPVDCPSKAVMTDYPTDDIEYIFENATFAIDHHLKQADYPDGNASDDDAYFNMFVVRSATATAEILVSVLMEMNIIDSLKSWTASKRLEHLQVHVDQDFVKHMILLLECLYTGILTDSVGFSVDGMTSNTFKQLSKIFKTYERLKELNRDTVKEIGADRIFADTYRRYMNVPMDSTSKYLLTQLLDGTSYQKDTCSQSSCYVVIIDNKTHVKLNLASSDRRLVNQICRYGGQYTIAGLVAIETEPGTWEVSLRSIGDTDVSQMAINFGGGGHKNASGFTLRDCDNPLELLKDDIYALAG